VPVAEWVDYDHPDDGDHHAIEHQPDQHHFDADDHT
jgi:hypothetical protein